jgi:hypothetical protein
MEFERNVARFQHSISPAPLSERTCLVLMKLGSAARPDPMIPIVCSCGAHRPSKSMFRPWLFM